MYNAEQMEERIGYLWLVYTVGMAGMCYYTLQCSGLVVVLIWCIHPSAVNDSIPYVDIPSNAHSSPLFVLNFPHAILTPTIFIVRKSGLVQLYSNFD